MGRHRNLRNLSAISGNSGVSVSSSNTCYGLLFLRPTTMASEKFGPHLLTIIEAKHIKNLYELWGIDYAIEIEAPEGGETPEYVRPGYSPMTPELLGLIATLRRGSPRWLAFTIDRIRAAYALPPGENRATPVGPVRMSTRRSIPQICFVQGRRRRMCYPIVLTSLPMSDRWNELRKPDVVRPLGRDRRLNLLVIWLGGCRSLFPWVGLEGLRTFRPVLSVIELLTTTLIRRLTDDDVESSTHQRRRRALEEVNTVSSNSPSSGLPPPLQASGEGTSRVDPSARLPDVQEASSWGFSYDSKQREVEVEGLKGKLAAIEAEKVALQTDIDLMKKKHRREIDGCKAAALREHILARRSLAREYDAEVRARIEVLTEYIEDGFRLEEELERLKDREISLDLDYGVVSVSDPSLSRLYLPEVSGDSVDQE
ncbi:hypothetical protein HID58_067399 [Brassica napus]|uniref:Uncharacterized protein n=1 Tax=Brassica napus TaxID=3708 RepID=A0ABQ7ZIE0_BRANA|nr:hypothetical protein HID58_067399 [Brassica napus]